MNTQNQLNQYKNLRLWNGIMAILHLIQGIIMVILSKTILTDISFYLPQPNPATRSFGLTPEVWLSVNSGYVIASFLFLSALAHTITITPKIYEWYIDNLKNKVNLIRWFEYAISSSVMIFVIALLCGIRDASTLILLVGINATMNLFGAIMEQHNSTKRLLFKLQNLPAQTKIEEDFKFPVNWSAFIYGCFAGILPWIIMGIYFFVSLERLGDVENLPQQAKDILNVVRYIFPTLFVFFNLFAINMAFQYKQIGKWKNYLFGEKMYIILSLTAKSFLAWFVWGGTLR